MPAWLRRITRHTRRISSWVLRSGARNESIWLIHAFCASWSAGNTSWSAASYGKFQSVESGAVTARSASCRPEAWHGHERVVGHLLEHHLERHPALELVELALDHVRHHARALVEID